MKIIKKALASRKRRPMRINQFLSHAGVGSRRKVEEFILEGLVKINGKTVTELSTTLDPDVDVVVFKRKRIIIERYYYLLLNKPKGYITTMDDLQNRPKVIDLIPDRYKLAGVVPVGRLDRDTEGLLLMTNDGEVAYVLTHPKYEVSKEYIVELDRPLDEEAADKIKKGVFMYGKRTNPAEITYIDDSRKKIRLRIREGKKRQIRITFSLFSYKVKKLKRISFGPLLLKGIHSGTFRVLNNREISTLKKITSQAQVKAKKR
jgi:pseudouridine synthase